jgi:hypothetical protein
VKQRRFEHHHCQAAPGWRYDRVVSVSRRSRDLVVVSPLKSWLCAACESDDGGLLTMEDRGPVCLSCADLDHLVLLPRGDAALTRRARKHSGLSAVVVRFSRARKRYERQGVLVEAEALERAELECLADEDVRARLRERSAEQRAREDVRFQEALAREIAELFPGCPPDRAERIARHTAARGSGRVGRTAAARALDRQAITLAVVAAIRHGETEYDRLLMAGVDRAEARELVRRSLDETIERWQTPPA